jgi:hypothetical protein
MSGSSRFEQQFSLDSVAQQFGQVLTQTHHNYHSKQ